MKVRFTRRANLDLVAIHAYLARESGESVADRQVQRILTTCEQIGDYPQLGRRRPELDLPDLKLRSIGVSSYIVFYEGDGSMPTVVRILHHSRDLSAELIEEDR